MAYGLAFLDALYIGLLDLQPCRLTQCAMLVSSNHDIDSFEFY
jgi:hypothetical protein